MVVVQGSKVFLQLEGRVELRRARMVRIDRITISARHGSYLVQGHQRRAGRHVLGLRSWVYAPFRVCIVDGLLHLLGLATRRGTQRW